MSKLRFRDRVKARNAAREIWLARTSDPAVAELLVKAMDGDEQAAKDLMQTHPEMPIGIDPATLFLLIQMAIKLWMWWQSTRNENPSIEPDLVDEAFVGWQDEEN